MLVRSTALALISIFLGFGSSVVAAQSSRACIDAAGALIDASDGIRLNETAQRTSGFERSERWSSTYGHQGVCRFDSDNRLFAVEIIEFPRTDIGSGQSYTVTCESRNNRRERCRLRDTANATVRLQRQLSQTRCVEGQTFGTSGGDLWVDRGCRGVFIVEESWAPYRISCVSDRYRRRECRTRSDSVARLVRTDSNAACTEGRTWGHSADVLWVDRGCSGTFEIAPRGGGSNHSEIEEARVACRREAQREGLTVREVESVARAGRYLRMTLRTSRGSIVTRNLCTYDPFLRTTELRGL